MVLENEQAACAQLEPRSSYLPRRMQVNKHLLTHKHKTTMQPNAKKKKKQQLPTAHIHPSLRRVPRIRNTPSSVCCSLVLDEHFKQTISKYCAPCSKHHCIILLMMRWKLSSEKQIPTKAWPNWPSGWRRCSCCCAYLAPGTVYKYRARA